MANEAEKERLGLLDQIRSIQEATNKIQSEQSSIMGNIVDDQTRAMEAAAKKELLDKNMLGSLQAMEKIDAVRAMMASSIADGTLETFDLADKVAQIKAESKDIDQDTLDLLNLQLSSLESQNQELKKKDIFGKSEADRLKEINDKAKENTETYKNTLNTLGLAVDELASMKTLVLAAGAGLVVATKEAFKLQRALGTSNGFMGTMKILGTQLSAQFQALGRGFVLSGDEARESIKALTDLQGSLNDATAAATVSVGEMAVKYGVGYKEAAQLNKTMMIMSGHSQDGADAMMNQVKNLAKAKGVAPGAVMQDIADNTVEFARFGKDGASGLDLGTVVAAGDALLDVQSSIQDEMKAEMLIGRQLNLDAARQAALTGDRDTLVKEIAKNAGTLSEFENMTVVQQRALAKAMGVQVGDVTKILQAKEKGVNLDSKVLDAQSAIADETNNTAMAAGLAAQGAASLGSGLLSAIPAFAGMNSMFPSMGKGISKMFGKTAEGAADVSNKMAKIKTPKGGGKGMTDFFKSLGKIKTSSMIKAALAIAIVAVSLIPAAYAFSLLEGVDPVAMLVFGATMVGLALALTTVSAAAGPMIFGALAFGIAAIALIPAAYAMGLLTGVDPMAMLAFAGSIAILGLGIAAMGALAMPIALGTLVLFGLSKVLPAATAGFANLGAVDPAALSGFATAILPLGLGLAAFGLLSIPIALGVAALALASAVLPAVSSSLAGITGVDPAALMGFAQSLAPLALGLAAFGLIAPLAIIGAAALIVVGAATILFAKSFALMSGVDPSAIDTLGAGIKSMIKIVEDIGFIQAGKLVIKAAAIAAVGLAVLPFGMAIKAAGAGDATGLVTALKGLTEIPTIGLVMAGIGISALALGFMAFLPVAPFLGIMAESLAIITPALALLAPLGEGLALAGMGVLAFGMGMFPLALGLMLAAPFIPLMPLLAEAFVIMTPPLVALAAIAEVMPLIGTGFMSIGFGLIPFAMGMAMLAPYIPLMPTMAESLVIMTPPLIELSTIAEVLPAMGMGFMMLGMGLQSFSVAMAMLFPFQAVLPILAKTMIDLAPPLAIMAPLGPQIMYLATAIGALGIASGIAAIPLYLFAAASYFAAPAITLLGEASKVLGAGLEMVRVPLLAMASQAPQVMLLATGITALGVSLAIATPPLFAFGAGAWFAMIPVMALASGLETMVQTADGLAAVGIGLSSIASGLSEISQFNGTMALLTIAAPALALLGLTGMFGGDGGEEGGGEDGDGNGALIAKIDELIAVVNSKDYMPVLEIDGRKVGTAVARKQGPKGMGN